MIAGSQQLTFEEITPEQAKYMVPLLEGKGKQSCESCFATIYMWRNRYGTKIARDADGNVYLRSNVETEESYLQPLGEPFEHKVKTLLSESKAKGVPLLLYGGDEEEVARLQERFPDRFDVWYDPADSDYIYRQTALSELAGKAYDGKRNHIRSFSRQFAWSYETLNDHNAADFLAVAEEWRLEKDANSEDLKAEYAAIQDAVTYRKLLHIRGGLLYVDGKAVSVTLGAPIRRDTFDIQIEKALAAYKGAYATINREFAARELGNYTWINRENDLGIEGLRRAKESYHPAYILKKYICKERT